MRAGRSLITPVKWPTDNNNHTKGKIMQTNESLTRQYLQAKAMGRYAESKKHPHGRPVAGKIVRRLLKRIRRRVRTGSMR